MAGCQTDRGIPELFGTGHAYAGIPAERPAVQPNQCMGVTPGSFVGMQPNIF